MSTKLFAWLSLTLLLAACAAEQSGSQAEPPRLAATATPTDAPATDKPTPTIAIDATEQADILPTETPRPTDPHFGIGQPPIDLPSPLLFMSADVGNLPGLWLLDGVNPPTRVAQPSQPWKFDVSPDGKQILYWENRDIWLLDVTTREMRQVTPPDDPESYLLHFHWWPNHDGFLTGSAEIGMCGSGMLTSVGMNGAVEVLEEEIAFWGNFAISPDGQTVAYHGNTNLDEGCMSGESDLFLYHVDSDTREPLDLADYGLPDHYYFEGLSYSPDGTKLGLFTTTFTSDAPRLNQQVIILDLVQHTAQTLYEGEKFGGGGDFGSVPVWSPSGDWLVFYTAGIKYLYEDNYEADFALWLSDASGVRRIAPAGSMAMPINGFPAISPDGEWIALSSSSGISFVRISDGALFLWQMPVAPYQVDWVRP